MKKIIIFIILLNIYLSAQTLQNMYFISEDIGWITYYDNTYSCFRTSDGGLSWQKVERYSSIDFVNDSIGYLVSTNTFPLYTSYLYKTTDKGKSWKQFSHTDSLNLFNIHFLNENVAYASGSNNIYKTTDGGNTWFDLNTGGYINVVVNENIIIKDIDVSKYFITADGGLTWTEKYLNNIKGCSIEQIVFKDSLKGYLTIVLTAPEPPYFDSDGIYRTTDGGDNWLRIPNTSRWRISMEDDLNGINYSPYHFDLTHDGFKTWETKSCDSALEFFYVNCNAIYACGENGFFAKSTDCGETWTVLPFNVLNPTSVNESSTIIDYSLEQNYPNPFNPSTKIKYTIPKQGIVIIKVYDVLGNEIMQLINEEKQSGEYEIKFDGSSLSSGIYFYQIQASEFLDTKKMVLIK